LAMPQRHRALPRLYKNLGFVPGDWDFLHRASAGLAPRPWSSQAPKEGVRKMSMSPMLISALALSQLSASRLSEPFTSG
jgi:hypothetical protein